jgi:hypothetical protein
VSVTRVGETTHSVINKSNGKAVLAYLPDSLVRKITKREGLPAKTLPHICCRPRTDELPPIPGPDKKYAASGVSPASKIGHFVQQLL